MRIGPFFPLANLLPITVLGVLGLACVFVLRNHADFAGTSAYWGSISFIPLALYLGACQWRSHKMLAADHEVEREIIRAGLVVSAAERCARFWAFWFTVVVTTGFLIAIAVWATQALTWLKDKVWSPVTWASLVGWLPQVDNEWLTKIIVWLGNTNFGVVSIIMALVIAAPLAAINHRANLKVSKRRKQLASLKNRPISEYETPT